MKITLAAFTIAAILGACQSTDHHDTPMPKLAWPANTTDVRLKEGVYEVAGVTLLSGASVVGAGIDKTVIRLTKPVRAALDGRSQQVRSNILLRGFTLDCWARSSDTNFARCGIAGYRWKDCVVEKVKVIGLGSFSTKAGMDQAESFGIIISSSTNCVIRDCVVDKNTGGYVSAYLISGKDMIGSNLVARFQYDNEWQKALGNFAGILQAFTFGGGAAPDGSRNVSYVNCRTEGASMAVFCDTGYRIDGMRLDGISGRLRSYPWVPARAIVLWGQPEYLNIVTNNVTVR